MLNPSRAVQDPEPRGENLPLPVAWLHVFLNWVRTEREKASIGFTLLELVVVIAILGTLASIAVPTYWNYVEKARETVVIADIRQLERLIAAFQASNGRIPDSLEEIGAGNMKDPWGNPYQFLNITTAKGHGKVRKDRFMVPLNSDYDLYSMGRDGDSQTPLTAKASHDDIIRANNGQYVGVAINF
jgi:general secretion pathway protein G